MNFFVKYATKDFEVNTLSEETLKENEKKYKAIFEQAAVGVARLKPDGTWLEVNKKLCDIVGYSKEELLTKTFQDITHPDDLEADLSHVHQLLHNEIETYSMHKRYIKKDGAIVWTNLTVSLARTIDDNPDYFISIVEDISAHKQDQDNLKASEVKLRSLLNSLSVGVIIHAPDTSITMTNPKACELLGLDNKQLLGLQAVDSKWKFLDENENIMLLEEYPVNKIISTKKEINNMLVGVVHSNTENVNWVLVNGFPILDDQNEVIEVIINFIDITELKNKDEMLISQSRHAAMGEMVSMIAHQWRQPISVISLDANNMLADIALDNFNIAQCEKYAKNTLKQTQHLSYTIDDFRNFFKPDKVISEVNLHEIIDSSLIIVGDSLKNNNIKCTSSFETDKRVQAYPRELMQVFVNIINNAKDALVANSLDNPSINIRVYEDEKYINIEISDNGGGIDVDLLSKIFDPYFSTKDEKTGTGLGLYMSKMIIEKHLNGIISVNNKEQGACFTVKLLKTQKIDK